MIDVLGWCFQLKDSILKIILKALFFWLLKSLMPFWFLVHCVCLVFSLEHTGIYWLFPVFWNFKVACFDVLCLLLFQLLWQAIGGPFQSGNLGPSVLENSISLVIFFIQSEESQALILGVLVFLYFLSFFNPLFICSSLKKINFFNLYNSFKNSGYLYLYIFLFIWHLDHALWMQYLLFLHLKNGLQLLKRYLDFYIISFLSFLSFSIIFHKDFPPVSANPWVLTYLRVMKYYNAKKNSAWKGLLLVGLPRE